MKVKVIYLPVDSNEEKMYELLDVVHINENLNNQILNITINDTEKRNDSNKINEIVNGTIISFVLEDERNTTITSYTKSTGTTIRNYYKEEDDGLFIRLNFVK